MEKSNNLNILNTQFPIRLFHLLVIIFISYVVSSMHISLLASRISVQEKRWQLKCLIFFILRMHYKNVSHY